MRIADSQAAAKAYWTAMKLTSFSSRLSGAIAARLWFIPWNVDPGPRGRRRQAEWLADTQPLLFSTTFGAVAGFVEGDGPTVLLVHGWGDRAASMGAFIAPLVGAGYRVVGIDLPGHGDSVPVEPDAYVIADTIREVAHSIGDVHAVVAHSLGAQATMIALRDDLMVRSVVLVAPSSRLGRTFNRFVELLAVPPRAERGLIRLLEKRFGESVWENLAGSTLIRDVDVPALIVHDRDDPQVPFEDSESLVRSWPGSRLIATDSLGHGRILRDENVIADTVRFVTSHRSPTRKELAHANG